MKRGDNVRINSVHGWGGRFHGMKGVVIREPGEDIDDPEYFIVRVKGAPFDVFSEVNHDLCCKPENVLVCAGDAP